MKSYITDFVGLVGVALVSYGAWLVMPAAGFIVAGLFILAGVLFNSRSANR
jgi:divalent metal cation (Fe/Co/Zn/Cd) transporter